MTRRTIAFAFILAAVVGVGLSAQSTLGSIFDRYTVDPKWAKLPAGATWGASTSWVAADGKGRVIAMVRTPPYFRAFSRDGQPTTSWGEDKAMFHLAHSVHIDPDGNIWASDPDDHIIHKFDAAGKIVLTLGTKGVTGDNASQTSFNRPNNVGFGPDGSVYVSDGYGNSRVVQFTKDGKFVRIIGGKKGSGPGEMDTVHGVQVDPQGRILVNDAQNKRLSVFGKDGKFVKHIAVPSWGGLQVTPDGTVYVSDVNAGAVSVLKNDQIVDVIKVDGRPHGLSVDAATGDVYTSSTLATAYNVTKSSPKAPRATPASAPAK
jgi:sugar lactone lactonase YvrE